MSTSELNVVTGSFEFSGKHITRQLLHRGIRVRTLTGREPAGDPLGDSIEAMPLRFDEPRSLIAVLRGARVLYNTYWVRFAHGQATHDLAVNNTRILIRCAADAGVQRFVHLSITNPSEHSRLSYFRGKADVERALTESGLSYAILRPALLFGSGDVLINNIAWMLRRLPIFGIFGHGSYLLQPVHVNDLATLAIKCASQRNNVVLDAVGPETFTYEQLVRSIRSAVAGRARVVHIPPRLGLAIGSLLGWIVGDVVITREEIDGLMAGLLVSDKPPTCPTRFSEWLTQNAGRLGTRYASELSRHYRRSPRHASRYSRIR
ncbi:MAG: NAD(P)H-binding protein [Phycisphaerae bacterium]|nr:NAD(P)H-binding protein [Phycisphaerae bacterium]